MPDDDTSSPSFLTALVAGGMAGTSVDVALFPIDTVKVRNEGEMNLSFMLTCSLLSGLW